MILSALLSKEKISLCLFDKDKPLEPQFYSASLNKDFLVDKSVPVLDQKLLKKIVKKGFNIEAFEGEIFLSSIDDSIIIPEFEGVKILDFTQSVMGFNYILVNFDANFVRQHDCKFEEYWDEILTKINYGIKLPKELIELIDQQILCEALDGVVENNFFIFANPYSHVAEDDLATYLKAILKDCPQANNKSRLIRINYDQNLNYFALSIALNMAGIDPHTFYKENPIDSDVNLFNLKGLKNYKISKNGESIEDGIKPNKVLAATTDRADQIKFSSASFKAETTGSILYLFDNRENEKK